MPLLNRKQPWQPAAKPADLQPDEEVIAGRAPRQALSGAPTSAQWRGADGPQADPPLPLRPAAAAHAAAGPTPRSAPCRPALAGVGDQGHGRGVPQL